MTIDKMVVADINGDHYDDIIAIGSDLEGFVIDVYLNEGKPRRADEEVSFVKQRLILKSDRNADAAADNVRFSGGSDLVVADLDNDGKPDLLASSAATGQIFVLWNQGSNAPAPFNYIPDTSDPAAPSMTFFSPLSMDGMFGGAHGDALGTPIYVAAADLKDGSGRKSIIAYHGARTPDPSSVELAPFDRRNYESLAIIYPAGSGRGFDIVKQRAAWPGCDLAFGGASSGCAGWSDGMPANASLHNLRITDGLNSNFADAPSDVLDMDGFTTVGPNKFYKPASFHPNASPGFRVLAGSGANGSDAIWLEGGQEANEFVADNALKLMRRRTAIPTMLGHERSAGLTLGTLSTGQTALIIAGGMSVAYDPTNAASAVMRMVPAYLDRDGQTGGWLGWAPLDSGQALLSLSDYCRQPDPCAADTSWYHLPLDGSAPPKFFWGGTHTLVMLDFAKEMSTPSGTQFEPFFQNVDDARFQAFSIMGGSLSHKPFIASGHFASLSENALVMLDHADGNPTDPMWTHLALYRPDTAKTYVSPLPHLDGLTVGRFIQDGLTDIGNTLPKGEKSAVLIGSHLGTDTSDIARYVTVRDKATHAVKGIFPVNPAEKVKDISKDGVVVPGLSTLDIGQYTLDVHNATSMASMDLKIVNPFGITTTNYDWLAGRECGILPNTKDGGLWPKQIAVTVTDFPGADQLQGVRWVKADGTQVDLSATGYAAFDAATNTVTLTLPQDGRLTDGSWRPFIKANGQWQEVSRSWRVSHDLATVTTCGTQIDLVNEEAYSQCTNDDYYLDAAQYEVWPNLVNGSFRFFGSGFGRVRSAVLKQGTHRFFSSSLETVSDYEVHVNFGDLSSQLTPDAAIDLYFYSEAGDIVSANGAPAIGGKRSWRVARRGACLQSMPHYSSVVGGSGKDGAYEAGDVVTAVGENLMYPVPTANRLILTDQATGAKFALPPRLPEDFYVNHYDNTSGKLLFVIPEDDQWDQYKIADGGSLVENWAPPPYVSYVIEAGTTAASGASAAAWAAAGSSVLGGFTAGIYLSGNTPTGVLNFIRGKLSTSTPAPGMPADDQREDEGQFYIVQYMSIGETFYDDLNIYAAVFRSVPSYLLSSARYAIYNQGRGRYSSPQNVAPWPCEGSGSYWTYACILNISRVPTPYGVHIPYEVGNWNLMHLPTKFFPGEGKRIAMVKEDALNVLPNVSREEQAFWRIAVPSNYTWVMSSFIEKTLITDVSHDCRDVRAGDGVCWQAPARP